MRIQISENDDNKDDYAESNTVKSLPYVPASYNLPSHMIIYVDSPPFLPMHHSSGRYDPCRQNIPVRTIKYFGHALQIWQKLQKHLVTTTSACGQSVEFHHSTLVSPSVMALFASCCSFWALRRVCHIVSLRTMS